MIGFGQNVNIPDVNFKAYLVGEPLINTNGDTEIQLTEATAFNGGIHCYQMSILDLTGIENFTALTYLECSYNQLTNINISQNIYLKGLFCNDNSLSSIDISQNDSLNDLIAHNNLLSSIDLSNHNFFINLYLNGNNLSSLDISHIDCGEILEPVFGSNPNLNCIEVNDINCWESNYSWGIDTISQFFSTNCSTSLIKEQTTNKELLKTIDILGRETKQTNQPLFYIYDDGTVEKRIVIE